MEDRMIATENTGCWSYIKSERRAASGISSALPAPSDLRALRALRALSALELRAGTALPLAAPRTTISETPDRNPD